MEDYGRFCYLDVQKTGSEFITAFLSACARKPVLLSRKHAPIRSGWPLSRAPGIYRKRTFYFNSVRHPFNYYPSLYNYGCDGRGGLHLNLSRAGRADLYGGTERDFFRWLDHVLDTANAADLAERYDEVAQTGLGFLSFRFLRLSLVDPLRHLAGARTMDDLHALHARRNICAFTIRTETMEEDLLTLVRDKLPDALDPDKARAFLDGRRVNASKAAVADRAMLERYPALDVLRRRESLVLGLFYPGERAEAAPGRAGPRAADGRPSARPTRYPAGSRSSRHTSERYRRGT